MKTIATAAVVLMMLAAPTWADDAEQQANDPANSNEPIVLSEAEMDGVTAGAQRYDDMKFSLYSSDYDTSTSTYDDDGNPTGVYFLCPLLGHVE